MTGPPDQGAAAAFDPLRPRLVRLAYRMLGSVADAEDVVQEAFIRWMGADRAAIQSPEAFLRRVVTRLSLDQLKSARRRRETYVGEWLPEPVVDAAEAEADDVTLPLLLALERLSPLERAAFILHDVFGAPFEEVAEAIGRGEAACRQLAARARAHVRAERPRFDVAPERGMAIAEAFFAASRTGDLASLRGLLAEDVTVYADGGGVRPAIFRPVEGLEAVIRMHERLARIYVQGAPAPVRYGLVNGLPGFVTREGDGILQTTALRIEDGKIAAVYVMRNPEKLRHLEGRLDA